MRIIRGKYKTRKFKMPKSFPSRPITDFAKEGLFNILEHQYASDNLSVLDLCSGTGSVSIEFLSREWGHVTAVDSNYNCVRHLKTVAHQLECEGELTVLKSDILKFLKNCTQQFDLIFADPPYTYKHHAEIAEIVFENKLLHEGGTLIIEHGKETNLENITHFDFIRTYGNVNFSFFENDDA